MKKLILAAFTAVVMLGCTKSNEMQNTYRLNTVGESGMVMVEAAGIGSDVYDVSGFSSHVIDYAPGTEVVITGIAIDQPFDVTVLKNDKAIFSYTYKIRDNKQFKFTY